MKIDSFTLIFFNRWIFLLISFIFLFEWLYFTKLFNLKFSKTKLYLLLFVNFLLWQKIVNNYYFVLMIFKFEFKELLYFYNFQLFIISVIVLYVLKIVFIYRIYSFEYKKRFLIFLYWFVIILVMVVFILLRNILFPL